MTDPDPTEAPARPRRHVLKACLSALGALVALPVVLVAVVLWAATDTVLPLPEGLKARIEARLDQSMQANRITVGDIGIALRDGGYAPQIVLSDVEMRDETGMRAAFPEVSVVVDGAAMVRGRFRPRRVQIIGAGLRLSRDASGIFDLALTDSDEVAPVDVTETLTRIDRMFAQPVFAQLEELTGTGLELVMADAVTGQVMRARGGELAFERKGPALTLRITGALEGSRDAELALAVTRNTARARTDMRFDFGNLAARDVASATPALAWLDLLRAPIAGSLVTTLADDGTVGDLSGELSIGAGQIFPGEGVDPLPIRAIETAFAYDATAGRLRFDRLDLSSAVLSFAAEGYADLMEDGTSYVGQLQFREVAAAPAGIFEAPLEFEGGAIDMRLSLDPALRFEVGQAVLFDGPLNLRAEGDLTVTDDGLVARVDARIPEIGAREVLSYWPVEAIPTTRAWLDENLTAGRLGDVVFAWRQDPDDGPSHALRFDFTDATLRALPRMPPIEGGAGYVSLIGPRFVARMSAGHVTAPRGGDVDIAGSVMVIEDTRPRGPDTRFDLAVSGPVPAVGSLLALPPVNLLQDSRLDPGALASGTADLTGTLRLPLRDRVPFADIRFDVAGQLRDLRSDSLIEGRVLTAGSLDLTVVPDLVAISGRAELDGAPVTGSWARVLGPAADGSSRAEGRATISNEALDHFGVSLPPWLLNGSGGADFVLDLPPGGVPRLSVRSDLAGIGLNLPALSWSLGRATTGQFAAEIELGPAPSVPELSLTGGGLELEGAISFRDGGGLDRFQARRFRLAGWADVTGALVGRGEGRAPAVEIEGGTVDLRRLPTGGGDRGGAGSGPITLSLDRLQVSEGIALTGLRAELTTPGGLSGQFRGDVNGAAPISGTLITTANGAAVRVRADDGGAVLRAAGVFRNGYGGEMELVLQPTGETGSYEGQLNIAQPRLRNAPAMAELLNLISVVGLLEQLGGEGINLGQVEASFRLTPRAILVDRGTAVGPSMGISMDGIYDIANRRYDMQGVVSPFYIVNGLFGALFAPRREGLFGFSYRLTGTAEDSNVSVNPLSILTPGIFREIFRRPPPDLSQ